MLSQLPRRSFKRCFDRPVFHRILPFPLRSTIRNASFPTTPQRLKYPSRLLIYHAGVGRTVFLGVSNLTTILLFAFSAAVVAPTVYKNPDSPSWYTPACKPSLSFSPISLNTVPIHRLKELKEEHNVDQRHHPVVLGGALPLVLTVAYTSTFATFMHLHVPASARASSSALALWARNVPPATEIDITTLRSIPAPRVTRARVGDLRRIENPPLGRISNLAVDRTALQSADALRIRRLDGPVSWGRPLTRFSVGRNTLREDAKGRGVWDKIWVGMKRL